MLKRVSEVRVGLRTAKTSFSEVIMRIAELLGVHGIVTSIHGGQYGDGRGHAHFHVENLIKAEQIPALIPRD